MPKEVDHNRRRFLKMTALALGPVVGLANSRETVAYEGPMPNINGDRGWLNSVPLNAKDLRGKVVLINFWTYTCINSLRPLPYVENWASKYASNGLVVIGVHTPEFSFEKEPVNVENALRDLRITFPVAIDSDYRIWRAFNNEYWPAQYFIDRKGRIRSHHFGEGAYLECERFLQQLLKESGTSEVDENVVSVSAGGVEAAPSRDVQTPETYVGYRRAERIASFEKLAHHKPQKYTAPSTLPLNYWALNGIWNVGEESAVLQDATGTIALRFHSRDLHLVLSPRDPGKAVRFRTKLDGVAPGDDHGVDSAVDGTGVIHEPRLYQLIRQKGQTRDRTFEIEFLDAGVQAFVFTFG